MDRYEIIRLEDELEHSRRRAEVEIEQVRSAAESEIERQREEMAAALAERDATIAAQAAEIARLREALFEADRFLSDPIDPEDLICARDVIRAALQEPQS